jgi:putative NIF3 family GTP cyclohydrolase 1 type 2
MKAHELYSYLKSLDNGWVNQENTVDTFKSGNPDAEVSGIAVGWMSYTWALKQAVKLGCNVFVTHEPTYYDHFDNNARTFNLPGVSDKRRFIEANELIILRCHDLWDQMPEIGIPDSWGEWLGLGRPIDGEGYYRVFDVSGKTALQVAQQIAERTWPLGQEAVALIGPPNKDVTRVSIGTGAITSFFECIDNYKVDLAICTDDGIHYWRDGGYAIDMSIPLIVVNHAVSEEAGLMNLAKFLERRFPDIPVHHITQRCMYKLIRRIR